MTAHDSTFEIPPFPAFPSVSRYVAVGSLEESLQRIRRSIDACEGLSLVVGPPGTGKTLMCAVLTSEYSETHDVVTLGDTPILDAASYYRHLLHHLGGTVDQTADSDLQLAIVDRVRDSNATQKGLLILIDEAQSLSAEVLEAIRMTTNIMADGQPRVYAVVCGGPKLDETLSLPSLEPLTQRIAVRCYLHPFNANETRQYVSESIRNCGGNPDETITDEAMGAVHHACCGVPRLINQLLTSAIDVAAESDQYCITDIVVDRAWAELQQLPSPMIEEPSLKRNASPIEFGELDESTSLGFGNEEENSGFEESVKQSEFKTVVEQEDNAEQADASEQSCEQSCEQSSKVDCENECASHDLKICGSDELNDIIVDEEIGLQLLEEESAINAQTFEYEPVSDDERVSDDEPVSADKITPDILFGEFEQEESVELGHGVATPTRAGQAFDLETMLHSEIVGIATDASIASGCEDPDFSPRDCGFTEQNSVQWLEEVERVESPINDDSDIVIHDDTDLLVIEDEVDLRSIDSTPRIDAEETIVSVDFQAMLSRMRHGGSKEAS